MIRESLENNSSLKTSSKLRNTRIQNIYCEKNINKFWSTILIIKWVIQMTNMYRYKNKKIRTQWLLNTPHHHQPRPNTNGIMWTVTVPESACLHKTSENRNFGTKSPIWNLWFILKIFRIQLCLKKWAILCCQAN